jgi:hypothetical protein
VLPRRRDDRLGDGAVQRRRAPDEVGHDVVERRPARLAAATAAQLRVEPQAHRLQHGHVHAREPAAPGLAAPQARERRRFQPLSAHGHDHGVALVGDHRRAVIDLHQAARNGEAPLREDHERLAGAHGLDQRAGRERLAWV